MRNPFLSFLLLTFLFQILLTSLVFSKCLDDQKSLLLQLNDSLVYDSSFSTKLVRWNQNVDCCDWDGVECDISGRVTGLELDNEAIFQGIDSSSALFSFRYLENLNLAFNSFDSIGAIPKEIRNLTNLATLNLSNAGFGQQVPFELSEITNLVSLDLSSQFQGILPLTLSSPNLKIFVQNLMRLEELYLDGVMISHQGDWWEALSSSLPNLRNLSLRHCNLSGPLNLSLTPLHSLSVLRLDRNNLSTTDLSLFAKFRNLTILTLSFCSLQGSFPREIFQVPSLQYMDLSNNVLLTGSIPELSSGSLISLVLRYTNLSGSLPSSITNLSMLSILDLSNCNFTGTIPSSIVNLSELARLDFSENKFTGPIPDFSLAKKITYIDLSNNGLNGLLSSAHFEGLSNILYINLGFNSLTGNIPSFLFRLPSLQKLLLSNNKFSGQVTEFSFLNSTIEILDLDSNRLSGPIPESFFNLQSLKVLILSFNSFNGTVQLEKIQSLRNLTNLGLAYNSLLVDASNSDLSLLPQLIRLNLASCNLNSFPNLSNQSELTSLDLSNNNISGDIPSWIWEIGTGSLTQLNISCNFLVNMETPYRIPNGLSVLDLHSNRFRGLLPVLPLSSVYLDYSSNNFQGPIPVNIGNFTPFASFFSVANNNLNGEIPESLCSAIFLQVLDLSGNLFSGNIPNCLLQNLTAIGVLNLGRNNISGNIPDSFSVNCGLKTLDLSQNNLQGKIPDSLANCKMLEVMNVGVNKINDRFPCNLVNSSSLQVLVLRSNKFYGNITCHHNIDRSWPKLQIIDLALNEFTGHLYPRSIASWNGMKIDNSPDMTQSSHLHFNFLELNGFGYQDTVTVTLKGLKFEFQKILTVFAAIDFSANNFDGLIPETFEQLSSLHVLNLSRNSFTGTIPESIRNLTQLESLDLSWNKLTGEIPSALTNLKFLSFFSVSYNNLLGMIPTGFQFSTFSPSSYEGNNNLCGFPLNRSCVMSEPSETPAAKSSTVHFNFDWQFIIPGVGYVAGLAFIFASLALSEKCREKCEEQQYRLLKFICPGYEFSYDAKKIRMRRLNRKRRKMRPRSK